MVDLQRTLVTVTSFGKKYQGKIDVPAVDMRTTDLLNSSAMYWRNVNEKCFDDAIMMYDVKLVLDEKAVYKRFDRMQIKTSEIVFFYDEYETIGDEKEKARAGVMRERAKEEMQTVKIITPVIANSFYDIQGRFYGLFKKKSNDKFIPLFDASIVEIKKVGEKWSKQQLPLAHDFFCINTNYIEALTFE